MIWANNINELQYYNQPNGAPCYCETLVYPGDLMLQGIIPTAATSGFTLQVDVLSPDGLTTYENATSYSQYYFFGYNGSRFFNLKLKSYSPAMCTHPCWILRVRVWVGSQLFFDKYTQRYCQSTCCDIPRGITFTPEGSDAPETPAATTSTVPAGPCGKPLIRIEVEFPCLDSHLADFYGIPTTVYSGTASFNFKRITNIVGKIRQRPREINREISYNCNLQRTESFKPYLIESTTYDGAFPEWKMNELEAMFHAPEIYITDFVSEWTLQFAGGVICEQLYKCWQIFKLKATLQSCTVRQIFGCSDDCDTVTQSLTFLVPQSYSGTGSFYSENRAEIGDFAQLINFMRGQANVTSVTDVSADYDNVYGAIQVDGTGLLPTSFYYDVISQRTRVFGANTPASPEVGCQTPAIDIVTTEAQTCATPDLDTINTEAETTTAMTFAAYGNWGLDSEDASGEYANGIARFDLTVTNGTYSTDPLPYLNNEIIAIIQPYAHPATPQSIQFGGALVTIDTSGRILYSGYPAESGGSVIITLTNIFYNLT